MTTGVFRLPQGMAAIGSTAMTNHPPTLVREATIADAAAVGEVHAAAWQAAFRDLFEPAWLTILADKRRIRWASMMATAEFDRTILLVAKHGDHVAAFAHFGPHRDESADGELYALYVHPSLWVAAWLPRSWTASSTW
jgi:hypothetical protein